MSDQFDRHDQTGDNRSILPDMTEGRYLDIRKKDIKPINDPKCDHEWVEDPTDDSDHWTSVKCKHCIVGKLIKRPS